MLRIARDAALALVAIAVFGAIIFLAPQPPSRAEAVQSAFEASVAVVLPGGGHGSGVVITGDGRIITAGHVCEGETSLKVVANDDKEYQAEILWIAGQADLCLIRALGGEWHPVAFAAAEPELGEQVFHLGNYVRDLLSFGNIGVPMTGHDERRALSYIGVAGPGSSGGGVFNMRGELVGLIYSGPEIVIPIMDRMGMGGAARIPKGVGHVIPVADIAYLLVR